MAQNEVKKYILKVNYFFPATLLATFTFHLLPNLFSRLIYKNKNKDIELKMWIYRINYTT
jgi:hypothetical protein